MGSRTRAGVQHNNTPGTQAEPRGGGVQHQGKGDCRRRFPRLPPAQEKKERKNKESKRQTPPAAPQTKTDSSILVAASLRLPRSAAPSPPANLTVSSHPPLPSPPLPSVLFRCQYRRVLFSVFGVLGAASAASRRPPPLGVSTSARAGARGFEPAPAPRCSPTLRSSGGRGGGRPFLCRTVGRCGFHFFFWWRSSSHFVGV